MFFPWKIRFFSTLKMSEGTYAYGFGGAFAALGRGEIVGLGGAILFGCKPSYYWPKTVRSSPFFGRFYFDLETILVCKDLGLEKIAGRNSK